MKSFFIFLLGFAAGAAGLHFYYQRTRTVEVDPAPASRQVEAQPSRTPSSSRVEPKSSPAEPAPSLADRARETAVTAKNAINDKLAQWHLTPEEIKKDLAAHGEVVRSKAKDAGTSIADATLNTRIKTFINAKYAFDPELSARTIDVECNQGHVTLRGTAPSETLIGKAVALALETDGVVDVKSLLVVKP